MFAVLVNVLSLFSDSVTTTSPPLSNNSSTPSSSLKTKPTHKKKETKKEGKHEKQDHGMHGKHDKHDNHDKHDKHDKHKGEKQEKSKHHGKDKHKTEMNVKHNAKEKGHEVDGKKVGNHKRKPTLSEQMANDKKMADEYRNLLKHPHLLRILEQMGNDGSGSGSGSGDQGSGEKMMIEEYMKLHEMTRATQKGKHGHGKSGLKEEKWTTKNSDVLKVHPVPLSELDIELIDALSSGAPSEFFKGFLI